MKGTEHKFFPQGLQKKYDNNHGKLPFLSPYSSLLTPYLSLFC